ncbi:MAG TPA: hypothetical protein PLA19_05045, partial [Candidatus Pacearchaeota archaeon]|nr:hypothetical protein [Candidatus Pacearchaeota archaeon]
AWDPPHQTPPGDNAKAPINVGDAPQGKLGNLGIGTASPGAKLDIADNGTAAGAQFLRVGDDTFLTDIDIAHTLGIYSQGDSTIASIKLGSNGGIISGRNNNIGIGTAAPAQKLDVRGHMTTSGILELTQQGTGNRHSYIDFHGDDTYTDYGLRIIRWNSGPNTDSAIEHRGSGTFRILTPDANSNIVLQPNKNVGIGPINPTQKLDVDGNAIARGELQSTLSTGYGQLRMIHGNYGAMFRNDGANTYFLLTNSGDQYGVWNSLRPLYINNSSGNVTVGTKLCLGGVCCSTWEECMGGGGPFIPVGGCTATLPAGNKKVFVTSVTYDDYLVHTPDLQSTMANADTACQRQAEAAGLTAKGEIYKALMYETACKQGTSNCNIINIARRPHDILPSAALWNGEKIGTTPNCEWHLVATDPSDMFSADASGNYLQNPIQFNELGQPTNVQVFTNFQPTGSGSYNTANTCFASNTCHYYWDGCYYGQSTSKNQNWAGTYSGHWNPTEVGQPSSCPAVCDTVKRALYCVEQ